MATKRHEKSQKVKTLKSPHHVFIFVSLCAFLWPSSSTSAAPNVTHLHPAGGQRGTMVEVKAGGTFDSWPVKVWVSGKGVAAAAGKDKGSFSFTVESDAEPG